MEWYYQNISITGTTLSRVTIFNIRRHRSRETGRIQDRRRDQTTFPPQTSFDTQSSLEFPLSIPSYSWFLEIDDVDFAKQPISALSGTGHHDERGRQLDADVVDDVAVADEYCRNTST